MIRRQYISKISGRHNNDVVGAVNRLVKGGTYKDVSTICIIPTRGMIHAKVVQCWMGMILPMNQKFIRMFMIGMEVGDAYSQAIETILAHPELSKWKYVLSIEDDNLPPPDGLLKLYESIEGGIDGNKWDVVGGLYWTKGEGGQPMIYGDPYDPPLNFRPQIPKPESIQRCNGMGMGFHLYRLSMFKDPKFPRPFFKTCQDFTPNVGTKVYTQDLYFYEQAGKLGYKFACDTRVKVGHYDATADVVW